MSNTKFAYVAPGLAASQDDLDELGPLVDHLLNLPACAGKRPSVVLNALISAYWTAAEMTGMQVQAAQGMVQIGGTYLAKLALAQRAGAADVPDRQTVH